MAAEAGRGDRLHASISGRVQGVGFRYFVQRTASEIGVTGWVRNRLDGRVELTAEAPDAAMVRFTAALRRGPPASFVSGVEMEWGEETGEFDGFSIRPTI